MKYKLLKNYSDELAGIIATNEVTNLVFTIPLNEANTDYQEYLKWVAEGNTAEAAD